MRSLTLLALVIFAAGCADKEATDPGAVVRAEVDSSGVREEMFPRMRAAGHDKTLRCGCDLNGGLHISAPPGSKVTVPEDTAYPSEAEIALPDDGVGRPLRRVKSLGFIGDNPLSGGLMNR